jgi:type II secretory pathway pseudopilin PulG
MGAKTYSTGFTIIETMLFLAISGMLVAAILVGSGIAINQQRYRDSVNGVKSYIQQQFNETANVINNRSAAWTCTASGDVVEVAGSGQPRGRSDCVIIGRLITTSDDGTTLMASNVIGMRTPGAPKQPSDLLELQRSYRLSTSPIEATTTEVSWGSKIVRQKTTSPLPLSILIVRSPLSGVLMTFSAETFNSTPAALISAENLSEARHLCLAADATTFIGRRLEVRIEPFAASQSAIVVPPESESVCD